MPGIRPISGGAQPCFYCFSAGKLPVRQAPERRELNPAADLAKPPAEGYALALAALLPHMHLQAGQTTRPEIRA
jgi:hypothetical protein